MTRSSRATVWEPPPGVGYWPSSAAPIPGRTKWFDNSPPARRCRWGLAELNWVLVVSTKVSHGIGTAVGINSAMVVINNDYIAWPYAFRRARTSAMIESVGAN